MEAKISDDDSVSLVQSSSLEASVEHSSDDSTSVNDEEMQESGQQNNLPEVQEPPSWCTDLDNISNDFGKPLYKRLLHIGPITALLIICMVGLTSTILHSSWWPIDTPSGCLHLLIFLTWNYKVISNFLKAAFIGGGYVPLEWQPSTEFLDKLQSCARCKGYKAPRSHHCSKCNRCVMKMDHHCPWINNCVGHRNQNYFIRFLFYAIVGCAHATFILGSCLWGTVREIYYYDSTSSYNEERPPFLITSIYWFFAAIMSLSFSIGVFTALSFLLYVQLKIVFKNTTGIEEYICLKAKYRREEDDIFVYPYDLGWRRNLSEVWNGGKNIPKGNGIWWPIRKGCTQFTFTEEQLTQKAIKRNRTPHEYLEETNLGLCRRARRRVKNLFF